MAKKIKNQIKRSMPLFIIICMLCSSLAVGLVFNYDINVSFDNNKLSVSVDKSEVQAQNDFATTTVTVKNAPPTFTIYPYEVPVSTSTSPINIGASIGFQARANDTEVNRYYLIVCDQSGVIASTTGGAPECTNTTLCVSADTASDADASCTYTNVVDPTDIGGTDDEMQHWYAYVCDNHSLEGTCSDSGSAGDDLGPGGVDGVSPFYVNHAPDFTAIATPVNNQIPGASNLFTVTASVVDDDTRGGLDELTLDVCQTSSWSTTTGCAVELCTGTSTTPDISCQFASSTAPLNWVAKDGTYDYYAYVKDWHEMPAADNFRTGTYTVANAAPSVSNVDFNDGADIILNLKTAPEKLVIATGTVTDMNGCEDIVSASSSMYWASSTSMNWGCSPDDDRCYQVAKVNCVKVAGTCGAYPDADVDFVCTTTLAFHSIPTTVGGSNPNSDTWWEAAMTGFDELLNGTASSSPVEVEQAPGLEVNEASIPFGSIRSGQDSGDTNATTTVENYGNTPLDTTFEGVDMSRQGGGGYIGASEQDYYLSHFTYGDAVWDLASGTASVARDLDLPKPTTVQTLRTDEVMWGINIPAGKLSGIYDGSNIFRSVVDALDW